MAKFDIKGILSQESRKKMDLPEQRIVYRSPEDLRPDKENFYNTEDIADLRESIRSLGLLQPLLIEKREDDKDYIIAGHRRQKCCLELLNEGDERFWKIPCVYTVSTNMDVKDDDITRQIKLIQANSYRKKTGWEEMTEALKMVELVQKLRKKTEMEGKSRDIAAGLLGTSSTQIGRYRSIQTNLSDDFMGAFKRDSISLSVAAELAGLKPEYQRQAYEIFQREGSISINDAKVLKARQEQERNIPGQMTIEQALHPAKLQEVATAIPVDTQTDRFFEALRKNVSTYILQNNLNMTIYMLSALYGSVRVRNGHLNYQGQKEGILFNSGSDQEELVPWKDFSERLIKKYGKKQKQVKMASVVEEPTPKLTDPEADDMPGPAKCITGQSGSGLCGAAAYCDQKYTCCSQCPDGCNSRCGWIPEKSCQPAAETPDKKQQEDHAGENTEMVKDIVNTDLPAAWPDCLKDLPIPTDTEITDILYRKETELKKMIKVEEEEPGFPHMVLMRQQMLVAGLRIIKNIVEDCQSEEAEEPEQVPLPIMKNNDQRKEWLRNYKAWGLWYEDKNTGVRYYKYDFENGARLIAEEFDPDPAVNTQWHTERETYYLHLVGGPEPDRADGAPKWAYHTRYNKYPNSETELCEFLKGLQK